MSELKEKYKKLVRSPLKIKKIKRFMNNGQAIVDLNNFGEITLKHPFNKALIDKYRFMGNIKFNKTTKDWEIKNIPNVELCRFILNINQEASDFNWIIKKRAFEFLEKKLEEFSDQIKEHMSKIKLKRQKDIPDFEYKDFLKVEPYPYQKVGIKFIELNNGVALIGDSMGLGKTIQAIGYTAKHNLKTIVVCPAALKYNWDNEVKKFTYYESCVLSELDPQMSRKRKLMSEFKENQPNYIIINYEQIDKYKNILNKLEFDCVILDESQYISGHNKRKSSVYSQFKNIEKRILLSGTAIKNRPMEFFYQLKFLKPDIFSEKEHFGLRYCDPQVNHYSKAKFKTYIFNGSSNARELNAKISPFYIRRSKENVLKDLPPKTIHQLAIELSDKDRKEYDKVCNDFKNKLESDKPTALTSLSRVVKIKQFLSKKKIKVVTDFVDKILSESDDKKVILFSQFKDTQEELLKIFKKNANSILSKYNSKRRMDEVTEFINNPEKRVLVSSTIAGGVGFNITAADTVIFVDLLWNPADHSQAEDRSYRIGQENPVSIYYLNYKDTIEDMLWNILEQKNEMLGQVLDGKKQNQTFNEKDVIKDFMNKFLKEINVKK